MNKFINVVLLFISFPTMLLAIVVGFDFPLTFFNTSGAQLPYRQELFLSFGLFLLIVHLRRSARRWMGLKIVNKTSKFKWSSAMSQERIMRVKVYSYLEALVMVSFGYGVYTVTHEAWMPFLAMIFAALETIFFTIYGASTNKFRSGITSKALIVSDRDVIVIYFNGLRRIYGQQQSVYFDFINDLQLSFPLDCIPEQEKSSFFNTLEQTINPNKVYFSKKLNPKV